MPAGTLYLRWLRLEACAPGPRSTGTTIKWSASSNRQQKAQRPEPEGSGLADVWRHHTVELGGIEPPSVKGSPAAIRPFPVRSVMATSGLGPLTPKCLPPVFPWGQRSFSPSAVFPCRPSLLLLPGCSDQAPPSPKGTRCVLFICLEN